jgi:hypothetical protein
MSDDTFSLSPTEIEVPPATSDYGYDVLWQDYRNWASEPRSSASARLSSAAAVRRAGSNPPEGSERSYDWSYVRSLLMPPSRPGSRPCPWGESTILNPRKAMWGPRNAYLLREVCLQQVHSILDDSGKMTMAVIAAVAEFERDLIIERAQVGLERAKANGKVLGRPTVLDAAQRALVRVDLDARNERGRNARRLAVSRQTWCGFAS